MLLSVVKVFAFFRILSLGINMIILQAKYIWQFEEVKACSFHVTKYYLI